MGKYADILKEYNFTETDSDIKKEIEKIRSEAGKPSKDVLKLIFGCIDLTSLNTTDTAGDIEKMAEKLNSFEEKFNEMPNVAAICVYPALIQSVQEYLTVNDIALASVAGGFPNSQTFLEVKIAETALAVAEGAQEIDVVMSVGKFLEGKYDEIGEELEEIKHACRDAKLKVILETGVLRSADDIYKASIIAMYGGADFIKTSTGKVSVNATPEAAYVMCRSIADFYKKTNFKVGFKAAGGVTSSEDAFLYYSILNKLAGKDRLNRNSFRIGASRLANNLLSDIYEKEISFF
jgi:deoxyribose-phosphate aldolase